MKLTTPLCIAQIWNNKIVYVTGNFNVVQTINLNSENFEVSQYENVLDQNAWSRVSYLNGDEMVVFNGYPTADTCGLQSQDLNTIGNQWSDNCISYSNMEFEVIEDDCSFVNIFL